MRTETKVEIVAGVGLAAIVAWIWLARSAAKAPVQQTTGYTLPYDGTDTPQMFSLPDISQLTPVGQAPGATFNFGRSPVGGVAAPNGSCGCSTCQQSGGFGLTFGSANDLQAWLAASMRSYSESDLAWA